MVWTRKRLDQALLRSARKARISEQIAHLDYLRALLDATAVMNQTQVAEALGVSQPAVSQACRAARQLPQVPEGRVCAGAQEAVKRYLIGELSAAQAASEIVAFTSDVSDTLQRSIDRTHCVIADLKRLIARLEDMGYTIGPLQAADDGYSTTQR